MIHTFAHNRKRIHIVTSNINDYHPVFCIKDKSSSALKFVFTNILIGIVV